MTQAVISLPSALTRAGANPRCPGVPRGRCLHPSYGTHICPIRVLVCKQQKHSYTETKPIGPAAGCALTLCRSSRRTRQDPRRQRRGFAPGTPPPGAAPVPSPPASLVHCDHPPRTPKPLFLGGSHAHVHSKTAGTRHRGPFPRSLSLPLSQSVSWALWVNGTSSKSEVTYPSLESQLYCWLSRCVTSSKSLAFSGGASVSPSGKWEQYPFFQPP